MSASRGLPGPRTDAPAKQARILKARGSVFHPRSVTAPIAALVMAGILYTYSVTSIRAAKRNAQLHREADGGQLDMRRESLRRHGALEPVEGTSGVQLFRDATKEAAAKESDMMGDMKARKLGERDGSGGGGGGAGPGRTETEMELEKHKGRGARGMLVDGGGGGGEGGEAGKG